MLISKPPVAVNSTVAGCLNYPCRTPVAGSELYTIKITIAPVTLTRWKFICRDCAGTVDSLVELLQGRLAKGVMDRVCRKGDGLFPSPQEIALSCSCPDWADMCKHVAAALYGVGARLDEMPQLLFVLRGVDENELLGQDVALSKTAPAAAKMLADSDVAALFGLEMAETTNSDTPVPGTPKRPQRSRSLKRIKAALEAKTPAAKISKSPRAAGTKAGPKWAPLARARKRRGQRRLRRSA